ncbi:HEME-HALOPEROXIDASE domain-containing protein [Mycena kentingensis (nom. inval.)]|nr:HEME-HALOPEROXIDASE domain-containing protein [Mycena kentingensis (nom. inval.)]
MRFSSTTLFLVSALVASAVVNACPGQGKFGFIPPKKTDLRGPCPALNSFVLPLRSMRTKLNGSRLANHGYLPRDGKNITIREVLRVSSDVYNIDPAVLLGVAKLGLLTSSEPDSFNILEINSHGTIEFDASLSREDVAVGDNTKFNESIYSTLANSNPGVAFYNITSAGKVMHDRLELQQRKNPSLTNTIKEQSFRAFTSALYLAVFGNFTTGVAPKKFVDIWFREERLPFAEGWTTPGCVIDGPGITALIGKVGDASAWKTSGGCPYVRTGTPGTDTATLDSKGICQEVTSSTKGK